MTLSPHPSPYWLREMFRDACERSMAARMGNADAPPESHIPHTTRADYDRAVRRYRSWETEKGGGQAEH